MFNDNTGLKELIEAGYGDDYSKEARDILSARYDNKTNNVIDGKLYIPNDYYYRDGDYITFIYIDPTPIVLAPNKVEYNSRIADTRDIGTYELKKLSTIIGIRGAYKMKKDELYRAVMNCIVFL